MYKFIFIILLLFSGNLSATVIEKGSITDKAVAEAITKTSHALSEVVDYSVKMLKEAKGTVVEQAPLIVKEFLSWRLYQCIFWTSIWWIIVLIIFIASWRLNVNFPKEDEPRVIAAAMRWLLAPFVFLAFSGQCIYEIIYILVAPRVYLIENLVHLIKYGNIHP